jgi:predicted Na+-dependent transporter
MRLFQSTTFWFSVLILIIAGVATYTTSDMTWKDWTDTAVSLIMFYAGKEAFRYGAEAYKGKEQ